jgi:hypothetical protein
VIVEPLMSHLTGGIDPESGPDCRAALDPIQQFCMSSGVTVIFSRGLRKDRHGPRTLHGAGSATIGDTVRSVLLVDAPDRSSEHRYLVAVKCPAGPLAPTIAYQITPHEGAVRLTGLRQLSDAEACAAEISVDPGERGQLADAEALLRSALRDGAANASTVKRLAEAAMISSATLFRARQRLVIATVRHGYGADGYSEWLPPPGGFPGNLSQYPNGVKPMEPMGKPAKKRSGKSIGSIDSKRVGTPPKNSRKRRTGSTEPLSDATME